MKLISNFNTPKKIKAQDKMASQVNSINLTKLAPIFLKLFQKITVEGTLPNTI